MEPDEAVMSLTSSEANADYLAKGMPAAAGVAFVGISKWCSVELVGGDFLATAPGSTAKVLAYLPAGVTFEVARSVTDGTGRVLIRQVFIPYGQIRSISVDVK